MTTKTKAFDCVKMKRQAQKKLKKEYETRQQEFDSYHDFLKAKADKSKLAKAVRAKIAAQKARRP